MQCVLRHTRSAGTHTPTCLLPPWLNSPRGNTRAIPNAERQILLAFAGNISNWAEVQAAQQLAGWAPCTPDACVPVCLWGGVSCDAFGSADGMHVTSL